MNLLHRSSAGKKWDTKRFNYVLEYYGLHVIMRTKIIVMEGQHGKAF